MKEKLKEQKVHTLVTNNNYFNDETGELISTTRDVKHTKILVDSKEAFIQLYVSSLGIIDQLDKSSMSMLNFALFNCQYNTNVVTLNKPILDMVKEQFGMSYQLCKNCISNLKKKEILISMGSGTYRINPKYYWRGNSKERQKTMKYIFELELNGK